MGRSNTAARSRSVVAPFFGLVAGSVHWCSFSFSLETGHRCWESCFLAMVLLTDTTVFILLIWMKCYTWSLFSSVRPQLLLICDRGGGVAVIGDWKGLVELLETQPGVWCRSSLVLFVIGFGPRIRHGWSCGGETHVSAVAFGWLTWSSPFVVILTGLLQYF